MTTRATARLELFSNIAVLVAAVTVALVLVHREWLSPQLGGSANLEGAAVNLAALSHPPAKLSLIMFISETCHFCEKEMPFYRRLRQDLPKGAALLAVFPRREPDPRTFLAARSVQVDQVSSSDSLKQIGVTSTPTLLLVDEHGTVKRAWVGAQAEATHEDIVASVAREL